MGGNDQLLLRRHTMPLPFYLWSETRPKSGKSMRIFIIIIYKIHREVDHGLRASADI